MMNKLVKSVWFLFALVLFMLNEPFICCAKEETEVFPIYGKDIQDGSYTVEVKSSSSMFRIIKAQLEVADGNMTAEITLSGTGYLKLYMGTSEEAAKSGEESYIPYIEDEEGAYTYTIPVEALDKEFACAAYSKKKEQWYDRQLMVLSSSLPEEALLIKPEDSDLIPVKIQAENGNYTMEITLNGGRKKAAVLSPAHIRISGETVIASIEWSSSNFDYMIVNGKKYIPVNTEGNSVFEIPVLALDQEIAVIADTVAMSKPHEIEYTLTFHSDTLQKEQDKDRYNTETVSVLFIMVLLIIVFILGYILKQKKKVQNV